MKHLCAVEGFREQGTLYEATCDPEVPQSTTTASAWGNTSARVSTLANSRMERCRNRLEATLQSMWIVPTRQPGAALALGLQQSPLQIGIFQYQCSVTNDPLWDSTTSSCSLAFSVFIPGDAWCCPNCHTSSSSASSSFLVSNCKNTSSTVSALRLTASQSTSIADSWPSNSVIHPRRWLLRSLLLNFVLLGVAAEFAVGTSAVPVVQLRAAIGKTTSVSVQVFLSRRSDW